MADFLFSQFSSQTLRSGTDIIQTSGRDTLGVAPGRYVNDSRATAALFAAHPRFVGQSSNGRHFRALPEAGRIAVELGGAKGDTTTDDGPAIRAAISYAAAISARGVSFSSAGYRMEGVPPSEVITTPTMVLPATSAIHDWGGARISRQSGGRGIIYHPDYAGGIVELPLAADVVAGTRSVTLATGSGIALSIGDLVLWQLGEIPYDTTETFNWDIAKVIAINSDVVTLDKPIPSGLVRSTVTGPNKRLRKMAILRDLVIRDLTLDNIAGIQDGIALYGAQRVHIERVGGRNCGAGVVTGQYCDGLTIDDCWLDGTILSQASFGSAFAFAESRNVLINRPRARNALSLVAAEDDAQITVVAGHFENTLTDAGGNSLGNQVIVINAVGRASITVHDLNVTGYGGYRLTETSNGTAAYDGDVLLTGRTRLRHPDSPFSIPLDRINGVLEMEIGGVREIYNFGKLRRWTRRFALRDGQTSVVLGPKGILVRASVYASPGLSVGSTGQLAFLYLGRNGDNGGNIAGPGNNRVVPGQQTPIPCYGGTVGGALWVLRSSQLQLVVGTNPGTSLNTANEFIEFEGWIADQGETPYAVSEADWRAADYGTEQYEALFTAYDLPAIAAGGELAVELAITDMTRSDYIDAVRMTGGLSGLLVRSSEALDGKARLIFHNPGTAPIDAAAADLAVQFCKPLIGS